MFWMRNGKIEEEEEKRPKPTPCPKKDSNCSGAVCAWPYEGKLYGSPEARDLAIKSAKKRERVNKIYDHLHYKYGVGDMRFGGTSTLGPRILIKMMYDEGMIKIKD